MMVTTTRAASFSAYIHDNLLVYDDAATFQVRGTAMIYLVRFFSLYFITAYFISFQVQQCRRMRRHTKQQGILQGFHGVQRKMYKDEIS
jgi:hypothetical protein